MTQSLDLPGFTVLPLKITIRGELVSGNHKWKSVAQPATNKAGEPLLNEKGERVWCVRVYITAEGREYDKRVKSLITGAIFQAHWKKPAEWVRMDVTLWNSRIDRDNVNKPIADALEGLAFPNDARVIDGRIVKRWDNGEERVDVEISVVNPRDYGRK